MAPPSVLQELELFHDHERSAAGAHGVGVGGLTPGVVPFRVPDRAICLSEPLGPDGVIANHEPGSSVPILAYPVIRSASASPGDLDFHGPPVTERHDAPGSLLEVKRWTSSSRP